ncbi:uncharacterized protein FOMMEDRAFT_32426 [Fomitiporia mediterranea MF3/22]|uniref:Uncharacterized protein n=1 Tax=Fomitiporia mediterranea (strain MF3/22) TaxID=694068 RepID=R7SJ66_FOMME|nr:uncharacterized protein FOMMEDRAFT_32426 [Fomitiporia mediterranea MF3/22]EJC97659.1 hypothetical protein FOMMEDRAFT_32426 [Fomitiporia mediterranea MF3/22]
MSECTLRGAADRRELAALEEEKDMCRPEQSSRRRHLFETKACDLTCSMLCYDVSRRDVKDSQFCQENVRKHFVMASAIANFLSAIIRLGMSHLQRTGSITPYASSISSNHRGSGHESHDSRFSIDDESFLEDELPVVLADFDVQVIQICVLKPKRWIVKSKSKFEKSQDPKVKEELDNYRRELESVHTQLIQCKNPNRKSWDEIDKYNKFVFGIYKKPLDIIAKLQKIKTR